MRFHYIAELNTLYLKFLGNLDKNSSHVIQTPVNCSNKKKQAMISSMIIFCKRRKKRRKTVHVLTLPSLALSTLCSQSTQTHIHQSSNGIIKIPDQERIHTAQYSIKSEETNKREKKLSVYESCRSICVNVNGSLIQVHRAHSERVFRALNTLKDQYKNKPARNTYQ